MHYSVPACACSYHLRIGCYIHLDTAVGGTSFSGSIIADWDIVRQTFRSLRAHAKHRCPPESSTQPGRRALLYRVFRLSHANPGIVPRTSVNGYVRLWITLYRSGEFLQRKPLRQDSAPDLPVAKSMPESKVAFIAWSIVHVGYSLHFRTFDSGKFFLLFPHFFRLSQRPLQYLRHRLRQPLIAAPLPPPINAPIPAPTAVPPPAPTRAPLVVVLMVEQDVKPDNTAIANTTADVLNVIFILSRVIIWLTCY